MIELANVLKFCHCFVNIFFAIVAAAVVIVVVVIIVAAIVGFGLAAT